MKKIPFLSIAIMSLLLLTIIACDPDPVDPDPIDEQNDLLEFAYEPEAYELDYPDWLGQIEIPEDNPMTVQGIELGRRLFYDPILSADSTMSCSSCHNPVQSFTDGLATSPGVDGTLGRRSAMSLINIAFVNNGLNWNGSAQTLEEQALEPVVNEVELHETWPNVISKLQSHDTYPQLFREAFGIADRDAMTKELAAKAIAQFERTLISYQSRYDKIRFSTGTGNFYEDDELNGRDLFFFELATGLDHPGCSHCHGGVQFSEPAFFNNGITEAATFADFPDKGLGEVTNVPSDNGLFRPPSLRNITLTAPYMHDGRFATLEEVIDHYKSGGHPSPNVSANIRPFTLSDEDRDNLIAFLHTLTDTSFINNPAFQNPF